MKILLDKNKPFYKANLHCHSTYSDGKLTVDELKTAYKQHGYSIIAFTDHEHVIDNSRLNDESFLAITSCEIAVKEFANQSTLKNFDMQVGHFNFYALDPHNDITPCYSSVYDHYVTEETRPLISFEKEYERYYSAKTVNEIIYEAVKNGFIVSYNHPSWSLEDATRYLDYDNLFAVEIYNTGCQLLGFCDDEHVFDDMLRAGKHIFCTACDDNHNIYSFDSPQNDSFGGWVCINAERLDYATVMQALQHGDFYASTGAQIFSLVKDGNTVTIETSPCQKIILLTHGRRTQTVFADNTPLTKATFTLSEKDGYFRIRVEAENGKKAYTQSYTI